MLLVSGSKRVFDISPGKSVASSDKIKTDLGEELSGFSNSCRIHKLVWVVIFPLYDLNLTSVTSPLLAVLDISGKKL